jgi:hypothetical protein
LIGHERVDVAWQLIATGTAVMVSVHIAVMGSIIGPIVRAIIASIAALIETVRWCAVKSSFAPILAISAWTLSRTTTT